MSKFAASETNNNPTEHEDYEEQYVIYLKAKALQANTTGVLSRPLFHTFATVSIQNLPEPHAKIIGSTEIIEDSRDPEWITPITVQYKFQKIQEVKVRVFLVKATAEVPKSSEGLSEGEKEILGEYSFKLSALIYASGQGLNGVIQHETTGPHGEIEIRGESLYETREMFIGSFFGKNFPLNAGFFTAPQLFLTIARQNEGDSWTTVWRGNKITLGKPDEDLSFGDIRISLSSLCNGDRSRPLRFSVWEFHEQGSHVARGTVTANANQLLDETNRETVLTIDGAKGQIFARNCHLDSGSTFTQYLQGGCEISLLVAIDFTYSNGNPKDASSLHYIPALAGKAAPPPLNGGKKFSNPYQQAIEAVGNVLQDYDHDNRYPVYGFGAQVLDKHGKLGLTSHCFNLHPNREEVKGVDGILRLYEQSLPRLKFSSPTYFTELIQEATSIAKNANCSQTNQKYFILLILTDGVIHDMDQTVEALVKASEQPLSIIIVGISRETDPDYFDKMRILDSDDKLLQHGSLTARRDIVQFVPFKDYAVRGVEALAAEVLAEIPDQLVGYMEENHILPNTSFKKDAPAVPATATATATKSAPSK